VSAVARRGALAWLPPALWCALIFAGSSLPSSSGRRLFAGADRVAHLVEYGVLGLLLARAVARTRPGAAGGRVVLAAALLGAAYGATDEPHQAFVPEREPEWGDLAADAAGALLGAALYAGLRRARSGGSVPATGEAGPAPGPRP